VVSLATDMGAAVDTRSTRRESAAVLAEAFPASGGTTTMLARRADASIFGAGQPSEDEVREYWTIVDGSLKEMTSTVGFWRRQQARFSPRSLLSDARTLLGRGGARLALPALPPLKGIVRRRPGGPETVQGATAPGSTTPDATRPDTTTQGPGIQ
jgi:hypothetical protein